MLGLILKDFYTMRLYAKQLVILLVFFIVISLGLDNPAIFVGSVYSMMFMMMSIYTFSYDNLCKWDRYAQSLPVTKNEIVGSKYLFAALMSVIGIIICCILTMGILYFKPIEDYTMKTQLLFCGLIFAIMLVFSAVILPFIFKFGVEKARLFLVALFALPTCIIYILAKSGIPAPSRDTTVLLGKLLPFIILVIFILSFMLSTRIYKNKEL